jgi:hypothetical protein
MINIDGIELRIGTTAKTLNLLEERIAESVKDGKLRVTMPLHEASVLCRDIRNAQVFIREMQDRGA